jgi:hypothetical protein
MDSDSQVGCLGNFFSLRSTLHRIKPPARPKSSSQSCNSQATSIAKDRSEVESQVDSDHQKQGSLYLGPHSYSPPKECWTSARPPSYSPKDPFSAVDNGVSATVERTLDNLNPKLRDLSLKIHGIFSVVSRCHHALFTINLGHPELKFQERFIPSISHQCTRAVWLIPIPQVCS